MNINKISNFIATIVVVFFVTSCTIIAAPSYSDQLSEVCGDKQTCEDTELCKNNKCVKACDATRRSMARNALCTAYNHEAHWQCPAGYEGQPFTYCTKSCVTSEECAFMDICLNRICRPGCHSIVCEKDKYCFTFNHDPTCY